MTYAVPEGLPSSLLGDGNLADPLLVAAATWGQRVALTHEGAEVSYAEIERSSARAAALLRQRGVQAGDRVALQLPNVPAFVALYFGVLRLGAVVVPMNPLLKADEIVFNLGNAEVGLLVAWHEAGEAAAAAERAAGVELLRVEDAHGAGLLDGVEPLDAVAEVDPSATAVILYTSGTTGRPKGAELTHRNLGLNTKATIEVLDLQAGDVFFGALPLYHSYGQTCTLNAAVALGGRLALITRFAAVAAVQLIERERVAIVMAVPTMYAAINEVIEDGSPFRTVRIFTSGGAPMPVEVMMTFEERVGAEVLEGYGLSETSPVASFSEPGPMRRAGSIGKPIPGVEIKIVDEEGREVPQGETGEILIRGHNVMKGYWRNPEATRKAITEDGWFHSGDLGTVDEEGFFRVVGRSKDMIIRGGLNVYPREVEEVLHRHPAVLETAVVGVPDALLGEEVGAAVALKAGMSATPDELREWAKRNVAPYKYPRHVWIVDELPKGPTGKILKRVIAPPQAHADGPERTA